MWPKFIIIINKKLDKKEKGFNSKEIYELINQLNNAFKIMREIK